MIAYGLIVLSSAVLITLSVIGIRAASDRRRIRQGYISRRRGRTKWG